MIINRFANPFNRVSPFFKNVNVVSVRACHRFHVIKSAFRHQHVSSFVKPLFMTVDTVMDTLNVCNVVKHVSSIIVTCQVFTCLDIFFSGKW